jgi:hypothetical protein
MALSSLSVKDLEWETYPDSKMLVEAVRVPTIQDALRRALLILILNF